MTRTVKALFAVLALALAIPGAALAHGRRGHHGGRHVHGAHSRNRHHHRHAAKGARVMHFRPTASPATATEGEEGKGSETAPEAPVAPESAGVVVSFEAEVLTIKLNDGTLVKGKVTEDTRLLCMSKEATSEGGEEAGEDRGSGDDTEGGDRDEGVMPEGAEGDESAEGEEGASEHGDGSSHPAAHDSSFDGPSHDGGWPGGEIVQPCETTALTPEATVREAELRLGSAGAVWEKVVLLQ